MKKLLMALVLMPMMALVVKAGSIADGLDWTDLSWTTGGTPSVAGENVDWFYSTDDSCSDGDCVMSGAGGAGYAPSWLKTTIQGPCKISFQYKFQTYGGSFVLTDNSNFLINKSGVYTGRSEPWTFAEFELGGGSHELKFQYTHPGMGFVGAFNGVHLDEFRVEYDSPKATTWYVNGTSGSDSYSGTSSSSAKKTIQAAIDVSSDGDTIYVAAGTYAPIVTANRLLSIVGVSGAASTFIDGKGMSRCADLGTERGENNTTIIGFTLFNGKTSCQIGAGVRCGSLQACVVTNCVNDFGIWGSEGGGAWGANAIDCVFANNRATHGAGIACGMAERCKFIGNVADDDGGAVHTALLKNCLIVNNRSGNWGGSGSGGACVNATNYNCTFVGNYASSGGVFAGKNILHNCLVFENSVGSGSLFYEHSPNDHTEIVNCFLDDPHFVDAATCDYHLVAGSPCIDTGDNSYVTSETDLDGNARIVNGKVDIGCY